MNKTNLAAMITLAAGAVFAIDMVDWQKAPDGRGFKRVSISTGYMGSRFSEQSVGGLCCAVAHSVNERQAPAGFPMLRRYMPHCVRPFFLDWGQVIPADAKSCLFGDMQSDWAHTDITYECGLPDGKTTTMRLLVSRLAPALLVQTPAQSVSFFKNQNAEGRMGYMAYPADGKIAVKKMELGENLVEWEHAKPWLLFWLDKPFSHQRYLAEARGDPRSVNCPVLFLLSEQAELVDADDRMRLQFFGGGKEAEEPRSIVMLPLFGDDFPPQSVVEGWQKTGLPGEVAERCDWWRNMLGSFPLTVSETCEGSDGQADVVTLNSFFEYIQLWETTGGSAPLPPMLALAMEMGFPVEVKGGALKDSGLVTMFGPFMVVENTESYSLKIAGMGKYALESRFALKPEAAPSALHAELLAEVGKMISAGHLAPWLPVSRDISGDVESDPTGGAIRWNPVMWAQPAETLDTLLEALPFLPDAERGRTLEYIKSERRAYPPEKVAFLPYEEGVRRERYYVSQHLLKRVSAEKGPSTFFARNKCLPVDALYTLERYYQAVPDEGDELRALWPEMKQMLVPYLERADWASLGWSCFSGGIGISADGPGGGTYTANFGGAPGGPDGQGDVFQANEWLKGLIGYIRLCRLLGDKEAEVEAWGLYGKACALRFALGKYNRFLAGRGLLPDVKNMMGEKDYPGHRLHVAETPYQNPLFIWEFRDEYDYVAQVCHMNEFTVWPRLALEVKYLPPFFRGVCPETGRFFKDLLRPEMERYVARLEENIPEWYTAFCESVLWGDGQNFLFPVEAHQIFLAKAWVCDENPDALAWLRDVPWVAVGDLYYIAKLCETLYSYAGCEWKKE